MATTPGNADVQDLSTEWSDSSSCTVPAVTSSSSTARGRCLYDENPFVPPTIDPDISPTKHVWPRERPSPESPRHHGNPDPFPANDFPQLPKRDGMLWVDTLIEHRGPSPMVERPHQLFLTGDRIYADQVSPELLPALNNLAQILVGKEELGADPGGTVFKPAMLEHFPPAFRGEIVRRSAAFTTSDGESHLLSFGEFVARPTSPHVVTKAVGSRPLAGVV